MSASESTAVLAVPCDQVIILNSNQASEVLGKIKSKRTSKKDNNKLEQDVKLLFTKPNTK